MSWAKEYLLGLRRLDVRINQKISHLDYLRGMVESISGIDYEQERVRASMGTSGDGPFVRRIHDIIELEAEVNRDIEALAERHRVIVAQILGLGNQTYSTLLHKRYVEHKSIRQIAAEMHYTYQYTRELHRRALGKFEKTYTNIHLHVL